MFTATYKRFVLIYYYIIILLYQVCSIQLYFNMPPRSTPSSVTKNRIKRDYHTALAGFADWYFNIFPNGDNVAIKKEKRTLLTQNNAPLRYFDSRIKQNLSNIWKMLILIRIFYLKERS